MENCLYLKAKENITFKNIRTVEMPEFYNFGKKQKTTNFNYEENSHHGYHH